MVENNEPIRKKLLSLVIAGRDDDYTHDFRYRITTTLNYLARGLSQLQRLDDVEIVITDWGSNIPLVHSLALSKEAAEISRFIYVPSEVVRAAQCGNGNFHTSMSLNVGIRRSEGQFIFVGAADILITSQSLEALFLVLEGKRYPDICPAQTLFLCPRYDIPWQFVERQPGLEEWNRYLLLSGSELNYAYESLLAVCSGAGALLMHAELWDRARGIDESYAAYGYNDVDLGLRVTQLYPWIGLSSLGVNCYHMGHRPIGRRVEAVANVNALYYNKSIEAGNEDWGLVTQNLPVQKPTTSEAAWKGECAIGLSEASVKKAGSQIEEVKEQLKAGRWDECIGRCLTIFPYSSIERNEVEALTFLAWYCTHRHPRSYVEYGIERGYSTALIATLNPGAEIYGFDEREGVCPNEGIDALRVITKLRHEVGHRAYARFLNGPLDTALERLKKSFVGAFVPELVFVRERLLGSQFGAQVTELSSCLGPGGAIVVAANDERSLEMLWGRWMTKFPHCIFILGKSGRAGMILADENVADSTRIIHCDLDVAPIIRHVHALRRRRLAKRLAQAALRPARFANYAERLVSRIVRRLDRS